MCYSSFALLDFVLRVAYADVVLVTCIIIYRASTCPRILHVGIGCRIFHVLLVVLMMCLYPVLYFLYCSSVFVICHIMTNHTVAIYPSM